jgi:hypothetical protein
MKKLLYLTFLLALTIGTHGASPENHIASEAMIVTKSELRRHMSARDDDQLKPATYADLAASRGESQPDYLVLRFRMKVPGHYFGQAEARIHGHKNGWRQDVVLHFNKGWVEYFIPLDGVMYAADGAEGGPMLSITWNSLKTK